MFRTAARRSQRLGRVPRDTNSNSLTLRKQLASASLLENNRLRKIQIFQTRVKQKIHRNYKNEEQIPILVCQFIHHCATYIFWILSRDCNAGKYPADRWRARSLDKMGEHDHLHFRKLKKTNIIYQKLG